MGRRALTPAILVLGTLLSLARSGAQEPAVKAPEEPAEQRPLDPAAVGRQMDEMKAGADALIAEAGRELKAGKVPAAELFVRYEGLIHQVMWPAFGPANAWLFNERAAKVGSLAEALGLADDARPGFEAYARVILAVLASDQDLRPFVAREAGLRLDEVHGEDSGEAVHALSVPLTGPALQADPRLGRIRARLKKAIEAGGVPEVDAQHARVRIRAAGRQIELSFKGSERFVLAEIISGA